MTRKQLQSLGERYGVFIMVDKLTEENIATINEEMFELLRKCQQLANKNFEQVKQKQSIDWDAS